VSFKLIIFGMNFENEQKLKSYVKIESLKLGENRDAIFYI
jgi:hypothetical protein